MDWDLSAVTPEQVATVPRAARTAEPRPRMLVGFDVGNWAYWDDGDLHPQGSSATGNVYNFSRWQYADSMYYYKHSMLAIPPTTWTNAAHRNGVSVIGTVTGDCTGCADERVALAQAPGAADKLEQIAEAYGFDGWLWDVESGPGGPSDVSQAEIDLMADLRSRTLPNGDPLQVTFYQAGTYSLEAPSGPFSAFLASGEFQADYDPDGAVTHPKDTYDTLAAEGLSGRRYDTYWASDVYYCELGTYYQCGGTNVPCPATGPDGLFNGTRCLDLEALFANLHSIDPAGGTPNGAYQSLSIYAPNWTMFGGLANTTDPLPPRSVFQATDAGLWIGTGGVGSGGYVLSGGECALRRPNVNAVAPMIEPRSPITSVPFVTRFNTGEGDAFTIRGRSPTNDDWNLLAAQDVLPTSPCPQGSALHPAIRYHGAFDGGSALRVTGTTRPGTRRVSLLESSVTIPDGAAVALTYRTSAGPAPRMVTWVDGTAQVLPIGDSEARPGGWTRTWFLFPATTTGDELTRIGVMFGSGRGTRSLDAEIGEIAVVDLDEFESPATPVVVEQPGRITWTDPGDPPIWYFDIWGVTATDCLVYVGRSLVPTYDTTDPLFPPAAPVTGYEVQPVSTAGRPSQLPHSIC